MHWQRDSISGRRRSRCRLAALVAVCLTSGSLTSVGADELPSLTDVAVTSSLDGTEQPSRLWVPDAAMREARPLLVLLHSWSGDYTQDNSRWQREAVQRAWIYLHPNFRGRNDHPEACGSPLARQDILDAVEWTISHCRVDERRIFLAGVSGGGHITMLMAGRHPERFSAASAWVGISDLAEWHRFHVKDGVPGNYARMLAACCGGAPGDSAAVDAEYRQRSPLFCLQGAVGLPLDLSAGVSDGKTGSVPIHHTLRAYNVVAAASGGQAISGAEMDELWEHGRLSRPQPGERAEDASYGRAIYLRRTAAQARVTIFEGGHESVPSAACAWLAGQSRPTAVSSVELRR
jgi:pimeloyl-ACP methyl ester carboxylesterase